MEIDEINCHASSDGVWGASSFLRSRFNVRASTIAIMLLVAIARRTHWYLPSVRRKRRALDRRIRDWVISQMTRCAKPLVERRVLRMNCHPMDEVTCAVSVIAVNGLVRLQRLSENIEVLNIRAPASSPIMAVGPAVADSEGLPKAEITASGIWKDMAGIKSKDSARSLSSFPSSLGPRFVAQMEINSKDAILQAIFPAECEARLYIAGRIDFKRSAYARIFAEVYAMALYGRKWSVTGRRVLGVSRAVDR